jgi:hypothetical protein
MFLPVIFLYSIYLSYVKKSWVKFILSVGSVIYGFFLSAFFIIPAFFEGKYTLRDIVTGDEYKARFVDPIRLIFSSWSHGISGQFSVEVGYLHMLGVLSSPLVIYKLLKSRRKKLAIFLIGLLGIFLVSIFLLLSISNFVYEIFTTLKKFQFPWRFLSLTVFSSSILASLLLVLVKSKVMKKIIIVISILMLVSISHEKWQANGYLQKPDTFYTSVYSGTTDTGESSPIWSVRFMEEKPLKYAEIIEGSGKIKELSRSSVLHSYFVTVESEMARVRENTLYFPGWKVIDNGREIENIEYQDPANRGLVTYDLEKGTHEVDIKFVDTKVRTISNYLSILAFIFVLGYLIYKSRK